MDTVDFVFCRKFQTPQRRSQGFTKARPIMVRPQKPVVPLDRMLVAD